MTNNIIQIKNLKKKLIIGTAQLFNAYGVSNFVIRKKRIEESEKIIDFCIKNNFNKFDTAVGYKNEKYLGNLLYNNTFKSFKPIFTTKISSLADFNDSKKLYEIEKSINSSLKFLKAINTILFHDQRDIIFTLKNLDALKKLFNYYKIKNFGYSIYDKKYYSLIKSNNETFTIQVPINIVNDQFLRCKFNKNHKVVARSIFLQGFLLNKKIKKIVKKKIFDLHENYLDYLDRNLLDPFELANSILVNKKINYFVFGFETVNQIREVLKIKVNFKKYQFHIMKIKKFFKKKWYSDPRKW